MAEPPVINMGDTTFTIPTMARRRRRQGALSRDEVMAQTRGAIDAAIGDDIDQPLASAEAPPSGQLRGAAPVVPEAPDTVVDIDRPLLSAEDAFGSDDPPPNVPLGLLPYAQRASRGGPPRTGRDRMASLWAPPDDEDTDPSRPVERARGAEPEPADRPQFGVSPMTSLRRPPAEFAAQSLAMDSDEGEIGAPLWEAGVGAAPTRGEDVDDIDTPLMPVEDAFEDPREARSRREAEEMARLDRRQRALRIAGTVASLGGGLASILGTAAGAEGLEGLGQLGMSAGSTMGQIRPADAMRQQLAARDAREQEVAMRQEEMRLRNEDRIIRRAAEERQGAQAANQTRLLEAQLAEMQREGAAEEREAQQAAAATQTTGRQYGLLLDELDRLVPNMPQEQRARVALAESDWTMLSPEAAGEAYERLDEFLEDYRPTRGRGGRARRGGGGGGGGGSLGVRAGGAPADEPSLYVRMVMDRNPGMSRENAEMLVSDIANADSAQARQLAMIAAGIGTSSTEWDERHRGEESDVPGWESVGGIRLSPAEVRQAREENGVRATIASHVGRLLQIHDQLSTLARVQGAAGRMEPLVAEAFQIQRDLQAQLRAVYNFGVPTGDEMQRIDSQIPPLHSVQAVLDAGPRYRGLISAMNRGYRARFENQYGLRWRGRR